MIDKHYYELDYDDYRFDDGYNDILWWWRLMIISYDD